MTLWRMEYQPATGRKVTAFEFAGSLDELDAYFLANHVCELCKAEMAGGAIEHIVVRAGVESREMFDCEPYTSGLKTPCGAEWDWKEIRA